AHDVEPAQRQPDVGDSWAGPAVLPHPPSGSCVVGGGGFDGVLHPDGQFWALRGAVISVVFEPVIPPGDDLLYEADGGAGLSQVRVFLAPGSDEAAGWHVQTGQEPKDGVGVPIGPATGGKDRDFDR